MYQLSLYHSPVGSFLQRLSVGLLSTLHLVLHQYSAHTNPDMSAVLANHIEFDHGDLVWGLIDGEAVISLPALAEDLYL
jgi:hypothetical protein